MKLFGRIAAILIAAIISIFAVQRFIRRLYDNFGRRYITLDNSGEE